MQEAAMPEPTPLRTYHVECAVTVVGTVTIQARGERSALYKAREMLTGAPNPEAQVEQTRVPIVEVAPYAEEWSNVHQS